MSGTALVKARDYRSGREVEAASPYQAFFALRDSAEPLEVGDLLECGGILHIFKFVGMEAASWVAAETQPEEVSASSTP